MKEAYLAKVRTAHPDAGGNAAEFRRIQEAFEQALEFARFNNSRARWLGASVERYAHQERLRQTVEQLGGRVEVEQIEWLKLEIGEDFAQVMERIVAMECRGPQFDDKVVELLARDANLLGSLRRLDLSESRVSDRGIERLYAIKSLRDLGLAGTTIRGSGLIVLDQLPQIEKVDLRGARLSLRWRIWLRWHYPSVIAEG